MARLQFDPSTRTHWHFCPRAGRVTVDDAALATLRVEPQWLIGWLATALPLTPPVRTRVLVRDIAWYCGEAHTAGNALTVVLGTALSKLCNLEALAAVIPAVPACQLGLVLTTTAGSPRRMALPRRYKLLDVRQIVKFCDDAALKLKHVDLVAAKVVQDAREVRTKFSKSFTTWFFPVGEDIADMVEAWVAYLRDQKLRGGDDPLFPATEVVNGAALKFEVAGITRRHWANAGPIRTIFREAFTQAGLPYFNPHSFRKTLAQLGERVCRTPEELKAWSQNLGHEDVMTTLRSYGEVPSSRQAEIIGSLRRCPEPDIDAEAALKALETIVRRTGGSAAARGREYGNR